MNFKKVLLALAAFGALFVTSCKEIQDKPITPVNITVSSDYIEVDSVGGTYTVDLYSSTAWTAEIVISNPWGDEEKNFEADPWISIDPVAGSASIDTSDVKEITINVKENVSDSVLYQREVIIYFRSDNMIYATTTVHQMGGVLKPNADTGPKPVTVAEFLSAEIDDNQLYELTGIMEGPVNTEYGNFDITDESGSVYVYGLTSTVILGESNDKSFSTLGYVEGDTLTIVGTRGDYNGKPEVMGPAYAVRAKGGSPAPDPDPEPELTKATVAEVIAAEVSDDVWYELTGTITDVQNTEYGNIVIEDETGSILVYGLTKEWNGGSNDKSYSEIGLREGDIVTLGGTRDEYNGEPQVGGTAFYISHVQGEAPEILASTIEDFLAADESEQWYQLTGRITNLEDGPYGNFDLVDETGTVYVYGLKVTADAGNQTFSETGLQEGDYVTLIGKRDSYNGEPQVGGAYYAAMIVTVEEFLAAEPGDDQLYHLVGTITNLAASNYGNFDLVDDSGSVYVYGLTSTPRIGMSNNQSFPELGYQDGDTVILVGVRDEYNGKPQVNGPAYAVRPKSN